MEEEKTLQGNFWFPKVSFIPIDYGNNIMKSNMKSEVCIVPFVPMALQAVQQEVPNFSSRAAVLY